MSSTHLTEARVAALLVPGDKAVWHSDDSSAVKLRVGTKGTGSYYIRQRPRGETKVVPVKLGPAGKSGISLIEAKDRAAEEVARLNRGVNPNDELRQARQQAKRDEPLNEIAAEHILWSASLIKGKPRNRSWAAKEASYNRYWRGPLGNRPASKITREDVQGVYDQIARKAPVAANRAVELLSAILNWKYGVGRFVNPTHGIRRERELPRERVLVAHEITRLEDALADQTQNIQDIIHLLLLTGARKGNVLGMRWADLDLDAGTWVIPAEATKTGRDYNPVLLDDALVILRRRHEAQASTEWVFPSPRHGMGHITNIGREWRQIRKAANIEDVHLHDLRATCATHLGRHGGEQLVARQLGHANGSRMTAKYLRFHDGDVRAPLQAAANDMGLRIA